MDFREKEDKDELMTWGGESFINLVSDNLLGSLGLENDQGQLA